jgi:hypothetical protein
MAVCSRAASSRITRAEFTAIAATQKSATGMKTANSSMTVRSGSMPAAPAPRPITKKKTVTPASQSTVRTSAMVSAAERPEAETRRL